MTRSVPFDGGDAFSIGWKHIMEEPPAPQMTTRYEKAFYAVAADDPESDITVVITVYPPDPDMWTRDFRRRR